LIGQAIGNLLKNAAEAIEGMPEEMDVQGQIRMALSGDERGLEITIEDNGPGFPEDVRERLLEPYVTTREKGTGPWSRHCEPHYRRSRRLHFAAEPSRRPARCACTYLAAAA
jgi:hypothetical protein